jgi:NAD-dependent dihydropyrimidine dehydrogenase PreA subunit
MSEIPLLDETRCNGCGQCVRICPAECLALIDSIPWLVRPADCVSCALCAFICPAEALEMTSVESEPISAK